MDLLVYWKRETYCTDIQHPRGWHFNSDQKRLYTGILPGERAWLVSGRPTPSGPVYVLLSRLVVQRKQHDRRGNDYGKKFRLWGDPERSQDYSPDGQDMTEILMRLRFEYGNPISESAKISQSLQTIRRLPSRSVGLVEEYAASLHLIRLARFRTPLP